MEIMYVGNRNSGLGKKMKNIRFGVFCYNEYSNLDCLMVESLEKILEDDGWELSECAYDGNLNVVISGKEEFESLKWFYQSFKNDLKSNAKYRMSKGEVSSLLAV